MIDISLTMRNLATFSHATVLSNQTLERIYTICSTFFSPQRIANKNEFLTG